MPTVLKTSLYSSSALEINVSGQRNGRGLDHLGREIIDVHLELCVRHLHRNVRVFDLQRPLRFGDTLGSDGHCHRAGDLQPGRDLDGKLVADLGAGLSETVVVAPINGRGEA